MRKKRDWLFVLIICLFIAIMTCKVWPGLRWWKSWKLTMPKQNAQINLLLAKRRAPSDWPWSAWWSRTHLCHAQCQGGPSWSILSIGSGWRKKVQEDSNHQSRIHAPSPREIVENLKQRTLAKAKAVQMLESSANQSGVKTKSIASPILESALAMSISGI